MIFDEIDAGIGGKVALSVGSSLIELGDKKQILCITHLPQIAAGGRLNYLIYKDVELGRTITHMKKLNAGDKVDEIARMLAGTVSEISRTHALELIQSFS